MSEQESEASGGKSLDQLSDEEILALAQPLEHKEQPDDKLDEVHAAYYGPPLCKSCRKEFDNGGCSWKTHCLDCYRQLSRPCPSCAGNLPINAKPWVRMCNTCFLKKRSKTHTTCPVCPPERSTYLNRRFDQATCDQCAPTTSHFLSRPEPKRTRTEPKTKELTPAARQVLIARLKDALEKRG